MSAEDVVIRAFAARHPRGVARVLEQASSPDAAALVQDLRPGDGAAVLSAMAPLAAARCLEHVDRSKVAALLLELSLDIAAALLRRVAEAPRKSLLSALGEGARARSLGELLQHAPGTAGALMDPLVLALPEELSAREAIERVRRDAENAMYYIYVVGSGGKLTGVANQRELMLASEDTTLGELMTREPQTLPASASREAIASHPAWQRVHALPVVDRGGVLLGAIRYETVRRLERELGRAARDPDGRTTASALAELYGLGLGGFVELASTTVRGPGSRRRGGTS
jgi:magnesium transporter